MGPVPQNYPTYGNMIVGPAAITTLLRIAKRTGSDGIERYTAYTSNDDVHWTRCGPWQHTLGPNAQIGISAENLAGYTMDFDYVRVYGVKN